MILFTSAKIQTRHGKHRVNDHCLCGGWFATKKTVHWFKDLPFLSLVYRNFVAVANLAIFLLEAVNSLKQKHRKIRDGNKRKKKKRKESINGL